MGTKINLNYDYEKLKTAMRYWLLGQEYYMAYKAMEMGLLHHNGSRKDGTPEFSHQIFQASFARTLLPSIIYPEETLATIFLHDIVEDCDVEIDEINTEFGAWVAEGVELMTNVDFVPHKRDIESQPVEGYKPSDMHAVKKDPAVYYNSMIEDPIASLAKGIDRMHNHQSMTGVFSQEKKRSYIDETKTYILPMLKGARKKWPAQDAAYHNIKHVLLTQIELIELML
jgi:(p)ppGpp synthase/HD superfamily hydrolase